MWAGIGNCKISWAIIFQKFLPFRKPIFIKEKGNKSQPTDELVRCLYTTSPRYSPTLKFLIIVCVKITKISVFFYWITQVSVWLRSPASVGNYSAQMQRVVRVGFSSTNFSEKCRAKRIVFSCSWNLECRDDRLIILHLWSKVSICWGNMQWKAMSF